VKRRVKRHLHKGDVQGNRGDEITERSIVYRKYKEVKLNKDRVVYMSMLFTRWRHHTMTRNSD